MTFCSRCAPSAAVEAHVGQSEGTPLRPILSALGLYFALLLTTMAAVVTVALQGEQADERFEVQADLTVGIVDSLIVLLWCAVSWRAVLPGLRALSRPGWYAAALGLAPLTFAIASLVVAGIVGLLEVAEIHYVEPLLAAGYGGITVVLAICVQPAVFEELAFRGVILAALQRVLHVNEAVIVSALLFMVIHLAVLSFPHLLLIGLALGWLRIKTGSLYPGMLLHFCHNLLVATSELYTI